MEETNGVRFVCAGPFGTCQLFVIFLAINLPWKRRFLAGPILPKFLPLVTSGSSKRMPFCIYGFSFAYSSKAGIFGGGIFISYCGYEWKESVSFDIDLECGFLWSRNGIRGSKDHLNSFS